MGQPLFWKELLPRSYWMNQLAHYKIKTVINFSPGCGMLERVCLDAAIPCVSVCKNKTHSDWVSNVLDRAAIASVVTKGSALFRPDIKSQVQQVYHGLIEHLRAQDSAA